MTEQATVEGRQLGVLEKGYNGHITLSGLDAPQNRIMVGVPITGLIRAEWMIARYGQNIPCNWSQVDCIQWLAQDSPLNFLVADARNIVASAVVEKGFEWLFFIDHDVILPPNTLTKLNERMHEKEIPIWSGLYFSKSVPSSPLVYRGRGNSYYEKWKLGDEVWVDGIPMGCTMIHSSILKALYNESEVYTVNGIQARRIFDTPRKSYYDPELRSWFNSGGTEDLDFCRRVIDDGIFKKAGWPKFARKKYPFMIDTNLFCRHIDMSGIQFPSRGEEFQFAPKEGTKK